MAILITILFLPNGFLFESRYLVENHFTIFTGHTRTNCEFNWIAAPPYRTISVRWSIHNWPFTIIQAMTRSEDTIRTWGILEEGTINFHVRDNTLRRRRCRSDKSLAQTDLRLAGWSRRTMHTSIEDGEMMKERKIQNVREKRDFPRSALRTKLGEVWARRGGLWVVLLLCPQQSVIQSGNGHSRRRRRDIINWWWRCLLSFLKIYGIHLLWSK